MFEREIGKLTDEDKAVCTELETCISQKSGTMDTVVTELLCTFDESRLYALSQNSTLIQDFCERKDFNEELAKNMPAEYPIPKITFQSIDGKTVVTPFHQLMGYYLTTESIRLAEAKSPVSDAILDKACKEGSYHALNTRLERSIEKMTAALDAGDKKLDTTKIETLLDVIKIDAANISNLYRSLGYFQAAWALLKAANIYIAVPGVKIELELYHNSITTVSRAARADNPIKKPKSAEIIEDTLETAMKYFYLSYFSSSSSLSGMLNKAINAGKNLLADLSSHFYDWDSGKKFLSDKLPKIFDIRSPSLFAKAQAASEHEAKSFTLEYPDAIKKPGTGKP